MKSVYRKRSLSEDSELSIPDEGSNINEYASSSIASACVSVYENSKRPGDRFRTPADNSLAKTEMRFSMTSEDDIQNIWENTSRENLKIDLLRSKEKNVRLKQEIENLTKKMKKIMQVCQINMEKMENKHKFDLERSDFEVDLNGKKISLMIEKMKNEHNQDMKSLNTF